MRRREGHDAAEGFSHPVVDHPVVGHPVIGHPVVGHPVVGHPVVRLSLDFSNLQRGEKMP